MKKILETERCYLREFIEDDVTLIHQMNTDPEVMKYITKGVPQTYEYSKNRMLYFINEYYAQHPGLGMWAAIRKADNQFLGWACLKHLDTSELIEIGYRFLQAYWGQGFATEISKALVYYGFEQMHLDKIVGVTMIGNDKSQHILKKVGLEYQKKAYYYQTEVSFFQLSKQAYTQSQS